MKKQGTGSTLSPFDLLKETLTVGKRDLTPEELKDYSPMFMDRLVSMTEERFVPLANFLNQMLFKGMTPEQHHRYLQAILPSRRMYVNYIKKPKVDDDFPRAVMIVHKCGSRDAEEIMAGMTEDELETLAEDAKEAGLLTE